MAFDEVLAERIRAALGQRPGLVTRRMFGGLAFLIHGTMCCGVHRDSLIARLAPAEAARALKAKGARPFDIAGRPMKGWLLVGPEGLTGRALAGWLDKCAAYAAGLPKK